MNIRVSLPKFSFRQLVDLVYDCKPSDLNWPLTQYILKLIVEMIHDKVPGVTGNRHVDYITFDLQGKNRVEELDKVLSGAIKGTNTISAAELRLFTYIYYAYLVIDWVKHQNPVTAVRLKKTLANYLVKWATAERRRCELGHPSLFEVFVKEDGNCLGELVTLAETSSPTYPNGNMAKIDDTDIANLTYLVVYFYKRNSASMMQLAATNRVITQLLDQDNKIDLRDTASTNHLAATVVSLIHCPLDGSENLMPARAFQEKVDECLALINLV